MEILEFYDILGFCGLSPALFCFVLFFFLRIIWTSFCEKQEKDLKACYSAVSCSRTKNISPTEARIMTKMLNTTYLNFNTIHQEYLILKQHMKHCKWHIKRGHTGRKISWYSLDYYISLFGNNWLCVYHKCTFLIFFGKNTSKLTLCNW